MWSTFFLMACGPGLEQDNRLVVRPGPGQWRDEGRDADTAVPDTGAPDRQYTESDADTDADADTDTDTDADSDTDADNEPPDTEDTTASHPYEAELQHCVDTINGYRTGAGLSVLTRSAALEAYAEEGAQYDAASGVPHSHFQSDWGGGIAFAENEIPGWPLAWYGSIAVIISEGTQMMWDEGPGGGHYENMVGGYATVGCGIYETAGGEVWVVQNFGY